MILTYLYTPAVAIAIQTFKNQRDPLIVLFHLASLLMYAIVSQLAKSVQITALVQ